ncbi:hypothetical protein C8R44DRAFT_818443 [Mycena epipterygia]|nr:hypothetical protein C8R44DRAFT_818443 [Mycena epipterygia]
MRLAAAALVEATQLGFASACTLCEDAADSSAHESCELAGAGAYRLAAATSSARGEMERTALALVVPKEISRPHLSGCVRTRAGHAAAHAARRSAGRE